MHTFNLNKAILRLKKSIIRSKVTIFILTLEIKTKKQKKPREVFQPNKKSHSQWKEMKAKLNFKKIFSKIYV